MATSMRSTQQEESGRQGEVVISRMAQMHEDGGRCDESAQEDSIATILIQCSMHVLLGISYLSRHVSVPSV